MTRFVGGALAGVLVAWMAYGQAAKVPFTLTWTEGKCTGCKMVSRLGRIQVVSRSDLWGLGFNHPVHGTLAVVHSTDGGRTWRELPRASQYGEPDGPPVFWFLDHERGWIAWSDAADPSKIIQTRDAGEHWQEVSEQFVRRIRFFDDNRGYAVAREKFLRTIDGGRAWSETTLPFVRYIDHIFFLTPEVGWLSGVDGTDMFVFRTTNGGRDWEEFRTTLPAKIAEVTDLFFLDQEHGWLLTWHYNNDGSYLYSTVDGGRHWEPDPDTSFQGEGNFSLSVRFVSRDRGFVATKGRPHVHHGWRRALVQTASVARNQRLRGV